MTPEQTDALLARGQADAAILLLLSDLRAQLAAQAAQANEMIAARDARIAELEATTPVPAQVKE